MTGGDGRMQRSLPPPSTGAPPQFPSIYLALLYAVVPKEMVREGYAEAVREGYLWHEFGDSHLLLSRAA